MLNMNNEVFFIPKKVSSKKLRKRLNFTWRFHYDNRFPKCVLAHFISVTLKMFILNCKFGILTNASEKIQILEVKYQKSVSLDLGLRFFIYERFTWFSISLPRERNRNLFSDPFLNNCQHLRIYSVSMFKMSQSNLAKIANMWHIFRFWILMITIPSHQSENHWNSVRFVWTWVDVYLRGCIKIAAIVFAFFIASYGVVFPLPRNMLQI